MNNDFQPRQPLGRRPVESQPEPSDSGRPPVWPHKRIHWWLKSLSRKQFVFVVIIFLALAGGAAYFILSQKHQAKDPGAALTDVPEPTTIASRMTGVQVKPELNELPVTAVMIENSPDARPQSGLYQADMVVEAIAEGGITRFLALYQESQPGYIGPVRSVRPYYLDFVAPYQASIAHAGGSGAALSQIREQGIRDLDHGANGSTYQRVSSRFAPHNLYTSRADLLKLQRSKGFKTSDYAGFARKKDAPADKPTAKTITLAMSGPLYNPTFKYRAKDNSYLRSEGGAAHKDEKTGKQINPKVVIALITSHHYNGIYSVYDMKGFGRAKVFQDGTVKNAVWKKSSRKSELILRDSRGDVMALNPGQTWITLVASAGSIKY